MTLHVLLESYNKNMSDAMNPLSGKFVTTSAQNVQRFMGGLKKQEDIDTPEQNKLPQDSVKLSGKEKSSSKSSKSTGAEDIARSGILSEQEDIRKKKKEILGDVPPQILKAAKKIVEGQLSKMKDMVPVPDDLAVNLKAVSYQEIMDIHDNSNSPIYEEEF